MNQAFAAPKESQHTKRITLFSEKTQTKGYTLSAVQRGHKNNEIFVVPDGDNLAASVQYNKAIASELSKSNKKDLPVVITFKKAMSMEELKTFENKIRIQA
ncbi:hypothetical protein ACFO8Q_01580 [Effusibacillus consociatus]|uniref:Uncharacterized protein n=1 Tax=Effusibacillus consociatus TaxID=1117041 RepID=A0ABV9PV21_9BACL